MVCLVGVRAILFIQFSIAADPFRTLILHRFQKLVICPPPSEFDFLGKRAIIHHLEFKFLPNIRRVPWTVSYRHPESGRGSDARYTSMAGTKLQIVQPVGVYVATLDDLKKKGIEMTTSFAATPMIKIIFDLTVSPPRSGGFLRTPVVESPRLCLSYSGIDFGGLEGMIDPKEKKTITDSLAEKLLEKCDDIPLKALSELLDGYPDVINAAASGYGSEDNITHLAFRFEVAGSGSYTSPESWKHFYSGDIVFGLGCSQEELAKMEWSVFIDKYILLPAIINKFRGPLSTSPDFSLHWGPDGQWFSTWPETTDDGTYYISEGRAISIIKFGGDVPDVCDSLDIGVDPTVFIEILASKSKLQIHGQISWDVDDTDMLRCAFVKGLELALPGVVIGALFGPVGIVIGALIGFFVGFLGALIAAVFATPTLPSVPKCTTSGTAIDCEQPIPDMSSLGGAFGVKIQFSGLRGVEGGLLLGGTVVPPRDISPPLLSAFIIGGPSPFEWIWENACDPTTDLIVTGGATYFEGDRYGGGTPVKVCEISIRNDSLEQFRPYLRTVLDGTYYSSIRTNIIFDIPRAKLKPEYLAAPYPCEILIKSNGGARWITLPPIPTLTPEIEAALNEQRTPAWRKLNCTGKLPWVDLFERGFEIKPTGPSDGPDWFDLVDSRLTMVPEDYNIWRIVAGKLVPGQRVEMYTSTGILAQGIANSRGFAELGLFAPLQSEQTTFSLRLSGEEREMQPGFETKNFVSSTDDRMQNENGSEPQALSIKRIQLLQQSRLEINESCIDFTAGTFEGYPALFVLTLRGLYMYDVSSPRYVRLSYSLPQPGFRSIALWKGMLITTDGHTLTQFVNRQSITSRVFEDSDILALRTSQNYLYMLGKDRIDVLSSSLDKISSLQIEKGLPVLDMAVTTDLIALCRGERIDVYDMKNVNRTKRAHAINGAIKISRARLAISKNAFYVHNPNGGGMVIDFGDGSAIVAAEYHEDPWFVNSVRVGNLFARVGSNSTELELYRIVGTKTQ